jgi:hypothetical protein
MRISGEKRLNILVYIDGISYDSITAIEASHSFASRIFLFIQFMEELCERCFCSNKIEYVSRHQNISSANSGVAGRGVRTPRDDQVDP